MTPTKFIKRDREAASRQIASAVQSLIEDGAVVIEIGFLGPRPVIAVKYPARGGDDSGWVAVDNWPGITVVSRSSAVLSPTSTPKVGMAMEFRVARSLRRAGVPAFCCRPPGPDILVLPQKDLIVPLEVKTDRRTTSAGSHGRGTTGAGILEGRSVGKRVVCCVVGDNQKRSFTLALGRQVVRFRGIPEVARWLTESPLR